MSQNFWRVLDSLTVNTSSTLPVGVYQMVTNYTSMARVTEGVTVEIQHTSSPIEHICYKLTHRTVLNLELTKYINV